MTSIDVSSEGKVQVAISESRSEVGEERLVKIHREFTTYEVLVAMSD